MEQRKFETGYSELEVDIAKVTSSGRLFQMLGMATAKA
jgi:hypothetical protein